ncbi:dTDP-4-dehydrorhamnose reductase [Ramlibacter rhizophilus]|uniref:dTDP-4-dehydrorhamnose reductase n=1 Tax=Ramlibacter rhizophilus TaxID=1781167 RepID=A0A4Z0BM79_9BURK|nr:dTDP-4-dehydrorhamnose reductase [Ramlibacter rhizophilus]TFY99920.1 dTDP-4-dehydrorhamnose reductase [Ramlibacter rhizophilus]
MKILLLGKDGQLGWELQRALAPLGELIAPGRSGAAGACGDLSRPEELAATVAALQPQVIVNAAAFTAVDRAEQETALARQVNALAPQRLAQAAQALGAWMVHFSTDYVFDGSGDLPWREDDAPAPLNAYGQTKLEGERAVRQACARHLVLRTSWVYGARGGNFAKTMVRLASQREALQVVDDQVGAPTGAELVADITAHALRHALRAPQVAGTYHLAAAGATSWHGYATHVLRRAAALGRTLKVAPDAVRPIASADYPTPARRPLNSRLDTRRLADTFGLHLPPWQQGVDRMLDEWLGAGEAPGA